MLEKISFEEHTSLSPNCPRDTYKFKSPRKTFQSCVSQLQVQIPIVLPIVFHECVSLVARDFQRVLSRTLPTTPSEVSASGAKSASRSEFKRDKTRALVRRCLFICVYRPLAVRHADIGVFERTIFIGRA